MKKDNIETYTEPIYVCYPHRKKRKGKMLRKYFRGSETLYDVEFEDSSIEKEIYSDYISFKAE